MSDTLNHPMVAIVLSRIESFEENTGLEARQVVLAPDVLWAPLTVCRRSIRARRRLSVVSNDRVPPGMVVVRDRCTPLGRPAL